MIPRRRRRRLWILAVYLLLLLASHLYRRFGTADLELPSRWESIETPALEAHGGTAPRAVSGTVRMVYRELGSSDTGAVPALLLHGSPGSLRDFRSLQPALAEDRRVIAPSLPGFGRSSRHIPDYSARAHAGYCAALLDRLGIEKVDLVAFSMGGAVALEFEQLYPQRVASITLISSIGVQELELLGNYELNHIIHGIQLVGLWILEELTPHFGLLDDSMMSVAYARNFYDTDQRPYRATLRAYRGPMLILHARDDSLAPFAAARESHRIVPQSELAAYEEGNHFLIWTRAAEVASTLRAFLAEVDAGTAPTRADAGAERLAAAARPFTEIEVESARGLALFVLLLLIVLGTFITEDLTCIATGLLIASGRLSWQAGFAACFLGIYLGDQLLYLAGRRLGQAAVRRAPWKWIVSEEGLRLAASWFERRGMMVILLSRFVPGTRLPTYLLAGAVRTRYWIFAAYFFVAVALWTPLLVGLSVVVGTRASRVWQQVEQNALWVLVLTVLTILFVLRIVLPAFTHRGRRLLLGRWRRITRWEFWPPWAIYPPVVLRILGLSMRRGGFARVTAVNPSIPLGGLVGESKYGIVRGLSGHADFVARTELMPGSLALQDALERAEAFRTAEGLDYPLVLKPDHGQRGELVRRIGSSEELERAIRELEPEEEGATRRDLLVQEYVSGPEYGVFYQRHPDEKRGRILSLTRKLLPEIVGDGKRSVERLILDDDRAVCMARVHMAHLAERLFEVPPVGERIRLVEVGTHSRGAIFLDGQDLITPALENCIDRIARDYEGFFFGRFDLRAPDQTALTEGRDFKILELNGLTGEATHIYDPRYSIRDAWRVLARQWSDAFAIADANLSRGARAAGHGEVLREILRFLSGTQS